jgi:hypothetical protein
VDCLVLRERFRGVRGGGGGDRDLVDGGAGGDRDLVGGIFFSRIDWMLAMEKASGGGGGGGENGLTWTI